MTENKFIQRWHAYRAARASHMPHGPKGLPFVGNAFNFIRDPLAFCAQLQAAGNQLSTTYLGLQASVWIHEPDLIEHTFVTQPRAWRKDDVTRQLIPLLGKGLLTSEGGQWRRQRKLSAPAFAPKRIVSYAETMVECTAQFASTLHDHEARDMHADMMKLTLDIVSRTLLGADVQQDGECVARSMEEILRYFEQKLQTASGFLLQHFRTPARERFERAIADLDSLVARIIDSARKDPGADYLLARLLSAETEDGEQMSDGQARDEVMTMLLAGHETTALTITYALYALSEHPASEARLREELAQLKATAITASDLERMPYLEAVVKEVLRLYPPAWVFGRQLTAATELGGYQVPAGVEVYVSPFALHRDPRFFTDPLCFVPERWLDPSESERPRYAYLPFGAGTRSCIGNHFAKLEIALVLATLLREVRVKVLPQYQLDLRPVITMRPVNGLPATVHRVAPPCMAN